MRRPWVAVGCGLSLLGLLACGEPASEDLAGSQQGAGASAQELSSPTPAADASAEQRERLERYWRDCGDKQARGCAALAACYHQGLGVEIDEARALALYERACELGRSCATVGYFHQYGIGTSPDAARALALYQQACAQDEAEGCSNLGVAYQRGIGAAVDLALARRYFTRGCTLGVAESCVNIGYLWQQGEGGPRDLAQAHEFYGRACDGGLARGCNNLGLVRGTVSEGEVISPSENSRVRVDRIALGIALPPTVRTPGSVRISLDGQPIVDPLALVREGFSSAGRGALYLATLDLSEVPPGAHRLVVQYPGPDGTEQQLERSFVTDPAPHRLRLRVIDEAGRPTSARVVLRDRSGPIYLAGPDASRLDTMGRDSELHSVFVIDGEASVRLDPGWVQLIATRGIRDGIAVEEIELPGVEEVVFTVPRLLAEDRLSADLHVHTGNSGDAFVPHQLRFESLVAAGLDVVVLSDHDRVTDPVEGLRQVQEPPGTGWGIAGVEVSIMKGEGHSEGHLNAFPLSPAQPELSATSDRLGGGLDAVRAHRQASPPSSDVGVLVQLNHPRGIQFRPENPPRSKAHALFSRQTFDRARPPGEGPNAWMHTPDPQTGTQPLEIDAIEVLNRFSWPLYREVRADWFALLNWGLPITGTGNTDSHGLALELVGFPVNLVEAPRPEPGDPLDVAAFVEAVRAGRLSVSTGPVVSLVVSGIGEGRPGDTIQAREGRVLVTVEVQAAPWVPVHELRLVVDGSVVQQQTLSEPLGAPGSGLLRARLQHTLELSADSWVVAEAGWPIDDPSMTSPEVGGLYGLVAPGYVPVGFTNPVWVDGDGDGRWQAPAAP